MQNKLLDFKWFSLSLPPVVQDEGSTASTETLCPLAVNIFPTTSMKDDFPAPGGPDRPGNWQRYQNQWKKTTTKGAENFQKMPRKTAGCNKWITHLLWRPLASLHFDFPALFYKPEPSAATPEPALSSSDAEFQPKWWTRPETPSAPRPAHRRVCSTTSAPDRTSPGPDVLKTPCSHPWTAHSCCGQEGGSGRSWRRQQRPLDGGSVSSSPRGRWGCGGLWWGGQGRREMVAFCGDCGPPGGETKVTVTNSSCARLINTRVARQVAELILRINARLVASTTFIPLVNFNTIMAGKCLQFTIW